MRQKLFIITCIVYLGFFAGIDAKAFLVTKVIGFLLKPVTIPLNFARKKTLQAIAGTAHTGLNITKSSLSNISLQAGFVKLRPFDFQ